MMHIVKINLQDAVVLVNVTLQRNGFVYVN